MKLISISPVVTLRKLMAALRYAASQSVVARHRESLLHELCAIHADCTILSTDVYDSVLGQNVVIHPGVALNRTRIGDNSYIANNSRLYEVNAGKFCSIGQFVQIGLPRHPSRDFVSTYPAFYSSNNEACRQNFRKDKIFDDSVQPTRIGHDVWIGSNVIVPGGIQIGTGAIIAAGAVVVKDVPPYGIVGGNPAKLIRYRFTEEDIGILLTSEWWNWPIDKIIRNTDSFSDIDKFKEVFG